MTETSEAAAFVEAFTPDRRTVADVFADVGIGIIPIAEVKHR